MRNKLQVLTKKMMDLVRMIMSGHLQLVRMELGTRSIL